jgi:hypothetical protein
MTNETGRSPSYFQRLETWAFMKASESVAS